jgi:hypothetical protein
VVVVAAIVAALAVAAGATLAVREIAGNLDDPQSAMLTGVPTVVDDSIGDAALTVGDIVSSSLTANAAGQMTVEVVVNEWTPPTSDDWLFGVTGARWDIDVNGDDLADGRVRLDVENGSLRGGVLGPNGRVRCIGTAASSSPSRSYSVTFDTACIGSPEQLRFLTQFAYDDTVFDIESTDAAPGWSPIVVNPAYVPPTTVPPPTTASPTTAPPTTAPPTTAPPTTVLPTTAPPTTASPTTAPPSTAPPTTANDLSIVSLLPARLLDSRVGGSTVDGVSAGIGVRGAGSVTEVVVAGRGGVPGDASAVVLNVTMVLTQGPGFATVFPCGSAVPDASNVNYVAGQTVANAVVAKVGAGGRVCVYTFAGAELLVDVNGYIP